MWGPRPIRAPSFEHLAGAEANRVSCFSALCEHCRAEFSARRADLTLVRADTREQVARPVVEMILDSRSAAVSADGAQLIRVCLDSHRTGSRSEGLTARRRLVELLHNTVLPLADYATLKERGSELHTRCRGVTACAIALLRKVVPFLRGTRPAITDAERR